jgi:lipopolysaccharide transport system ATP-binding protein
MSAPAIRGELLSKRYRLGGGGRSSRCGRASSGAFRRPLSGRRHREHIWALDAVSFEVAEGEAVGVIGRLVPARAPAQCCPGSPSPPAAAPRCAAGSAACSEVGTGFHPELTGRENIALNGAILGMRRAEIAAKFDEIVDFAGVERFIDTPVKRYSSGMYLRLAFAVAAHLEPEILLVDEVLAVGDLAFQKKCLGKMGGVATQDGRCCSSAINSWPFRTCARGAAG